MENRLKKIIKCLKKMKKMGYNTKVKRFLIHKEKIFDN